MPTFKSFDFQVLQMRYIKGAAVQIPAYLPDGKNAAAVQALIDAAETAKTAYLNEDQTVGLARGELDEIHSAAHLLCIQVYPIMKSRYRTDHGSLKAINRLPVDDKTVRNTIDRMSAMSLLWSQLPNPPGSATPFTAWGGMNRAAFDTVKDALKTQDDALPEIIQDYERLQMEYHTQSQIVGDFVTAALIQGRAQFPEGTPEREIIEAIPMEQAQQPPAQAVITLAQSPAAGEVLLEYDAAHGTMFDIFQKGPGDADFVQVANDAITRSYSASGLPAGDYDFKVAGQNSLGNGPQSEVATISVAGGSLAQPTGLTLQPGPMNSIIANWNAVPSATHYEVEKRLIGTDPSFVVVGSPGSPTLQFGGFSSGSVVHVRIRAFGTPGPGGTPQSPYSTVAEITFP